VCKEPNGHYKLFLEYDQNNETNQTQWFFFSAMNIKKGQTVTFHISNLYKEESLYNNGMKPFVFSTKSNGLEGNKKWKRDCFTISYYRNGKTVAGSNLHSDQMAQKKSERKYRSLSTLQFSYTFDYDQDCVFFSHFAPYTYSQLCHFINGIPEEFDSAHVNQFL